MESSQNNELQTGVNGVGAEESKEASKKSDDFHSMLEDNLKTHPLSDEHIRRGALVEGTIIKITSEDVFLDLGLKTEGRIALNEFDNQTHPKEGDTIKAIVASKTPDSIVLSFSKIKELHSFEGLQQVYENKLRVTAKIKEIVKGGVIAEISGNIKAFIPISQLDVNHIDEQSLPQYIGKKIECIITQLSKGSIVLSHRRIIQEEEEQKKELFFNEHKEGDIVMGVVKNHASFGVFIDLGGFDGLLHVSDLGWGRNIKQSDVAPHGKELRLLITKVDKEKKKINLSLKALEANPWETLGERYKEGDTVNGTVVKILPYGAFIHLENGIEGFVHISDMSWSKRINHPKDILKVHSVVECKVLSIDQENLRISLGIKQVSPNPWDKVGETYPEGLKVSAIVAQVLNSGTIVEVEEGIKGFIAFENYSWNLKNIPKLVKGETVECKVLFHDHENQEIKLGIKQLSENPWKKRDLEVGKVVEGIVSNVTDFGIFLKIRDGIEGLIPKSHSFDPVEHSSYDEVRSYFKKGQQIQAVVQNIDITNHKLSLSIRKLNEASAKKELDKHLVASEEIHSVNLGDILNSNNDDNK